MVQVKLENWPIILLNFEQEQTWRFCSWLSGTLSGLVVIMDKVITLMPTRAYNDFFGFFVLKTEVFEMKQCLQKTILKIMYNYN